ncbi:hypothetical protein FSP39_024885 [Pinctada imbricata]|uniref:Reverse transcriptase domain-containing protein n=1 Tax=Pinctada imbricata TaxID=66713 RepID=A0AA89BYA2_PINIB|nr:hypothetical protein FSP39_024885 [Pinctada imbricata]
MATRLTDSEIHGLQSFSVEDTNNIGTRWKRWLRSFELYAGGKGVSQPEQKKALLLHTAGSRVQDIFFTLTLEQGEEGDTAYDKTVKTLNKRFTPQVNIPFERHVFRKMTQSPAETVEQFITRLRLQSETCDFGDEDAVNEQIRDQVIEKCVSHHLRRKLLEKGRGLTLDQLKQTARAIEESDRQAKAMEGVSINEVNKLNFGRKNDRRRKPGQGSVSKPSANSNITCFNCGNKGHKAKHSSCPAIGRSCNYCKIEGHFELCCKKKVKDGSRKGKKEVRQLTQNEPDGEHKYAFLVIHKVDSQRDGIDSVCVNIGGIDLSAVIDSGATCNVMDRAQWEDLKRQNVICTSTKESKPLFAYGSKTPLPVAGSIKATVRANNCEILDAEFIVIEGEGQCLLGRDTATKLNLLRLGPEVNAVSGEGSTGKHPVLTKYASAFTGLGKLKDFKLEVPIDRDVEPVVQPVRRIPFSLRDRLEQKLDELENLDIIEKATGPTTWVSPVVVVPKGQDDIRICVDMRRANSAVKRERYPIPTMAEVLQDMNHGKVFSKIDINLAYHQIELSENCRDITTFATHKGLYRYKRLMFGISCAPEMYQRVLSTILQDCEGVENFMDDIVEYGENESEHNVRLERAIERLVEKGFTLNPDKCQFCMSKIEYLGHVLSGKGIDLHEDKVKAIVDARAPESASEVKSFLGLVNFCAKFIPDLATINEPLRNLTKKGVPFKWGKEQQKSFNLLKDHLSKADTLGYFDKNAPTQIITDASPVGLGAVLVQKQGHEYRVISYASRSLDETERRYSQTEKEALAIVWACISMGSR